MNPSRIAGNARILIIVLEYRANRRASGASDMINTNIFSLRFILFSYSISAVKSTANENSTEYDVVIGDMSCPQ
jgi:hypothetical protein